MLALLPDPEDVCQHWGWIEEEGDVMLFGFWCRFRLQTSSSELKYVAIDVG